MPHARVRVRARAHVCVCVCVRVCVCVWVYMWEAGTLVVKFCSNNESPKRSSVKSSDDAESSDQSLSATVKRARRSKNCKQWGCIVRCVCESPWASLCGWGCEGVSVTEGQPRSLVEPAQRPCAIAQVFDAFSDGR